MVVQIFWMAGSLIIVSGIVMLIINTYQLVRVKSLHKEYREYVQMLANGNPTWDFIRRPPEIKDLFAKADVGTPKIPRTEPLGLGQIININLDVVDNMAKNDREVIHIMFHLFHLAEGTFLFRIRQSINPIYWLETIIFLPSIILGFVGLPQTSVISKTANAIMWIFGALGFVFSLPDFYDMRDATSAYLAEFFNFFSH